MRGVFTEDKTLASFTVSSYWSSSGVVGPAKGRQQWWYSRMHASEARYVRAIQQASIGVLAGPFADTPWMLESCITT